MECRVDLSRVNERIDWLRSLTMENAVEEIVKVVPHEDEDILWSAAALTSARYVMQEAHNLLGFVSHAMIGCEDARALAKTQEPRLRHLLLVQALYQVVFDLNDPCLSPYQLLDVRPFREETLDESLRWVRVDVRMGESLRVDHRLAALREDMPRADLIDFLLDVGMEGMVTDDHTFITPALSLSMMQNLIGWDAGFDMLRCALRYSASFPRHFEVYDRAIALREQYNLTEGAPNTTYEPERVAALRQRLYDAPPADRPAIAARVMAQENVAPATVLAAASLTATDFYLKVAPVPHQDFDAVSREVAPIHIGNCISTIRMSFPLMSPKTQVLAAIQAGSLLERGPSVLNKDFEFIPFMPEVDYPYPEDVKRLSSQSPTDLLDTLREAIPAHDYRTTTAAVKAYANANAAPEPLIALLTEFSCMDNHTLLHNFKNLNSMVKEFYLCNLPDRWNYLMEAARFIAWYVGVDKSVYERAVAALDAQTAPVT